MRPVRIRGCLTGCIGVCLVLVRPVLCILLYFDFQRQFLINALILFISEEHIVYPVVAVIEEGRGSDAKLKPLFPAVGMGGVKPPPFSFKEGCAEFVVHRLPVYGISPEGCAGYIKGLQQHLSHIGVSAAAVKLFVFISGFHFFNAVIDGPGMVIMSPFVFQVVIHPLHHRLNFFPVTCASLGYLLRKITDCFFPFTKLLPFYPFLRIAFGSVFKPPHLGMFIFSLFRKPFFRPFP